MLNPLIIFVTLGKMKLWHKENRFVTYEMKENKKNKKHKCFNNYIVRLIMIDEHIHVF